MIDVDKEWLIIVDEAHHMIEENKWGKLCEIFKRCRVIGATATPCRLDRVLLKRGEGGVFDTLIQAEALRNDSVETLIKRGFLSPFKCFGIKTRLDLTELRLGKNDYTLSSLTNETTRHVQEMAGDAVEHYVRLAHNRQAVVFCVSIEIAKLTASWFKSAGIASAAIHSKMGKPEVDRVFDLFESKQIQVLCNVDMTGEGVDIPAIEALIMLRKTASFALYRQWIGRSLRPCPGKEFAIIIDHADNIRAHGLPNEHVEWSLDRAPAQQKSNLVPCPECGFLIKAWEMECPECGSQLRRETAHAEKDVMYIDVQLVELHRTKMAKEARDNAIASTVSHDEIMNLKKTGGKVGELTTKVAMWFFDSIKSDVTVKQIESFFVFNNNMQFWATHFTLADTKKINKKKCLRVFNETQRNM